MIARKKVEDNYGTGASLQPQASDKVEQCFCITNELITVTNKLTENTIHKRLKTWQLDVLSIINNINGLTKHFDD